jgi:hypothetical protein
VTHVAIVFPGMSYVHHHPVLHYVESALAQSGAAVDRVAYTVLDEWSGQQPFWTPEREAEFFAEIRAHARDVLSTRPDRVTLVGKSLGTQALAALVDEPALPPDTDAIWLTPVFGDDAVFDGARRARWRSLFVVGLADTAHVPERQAQVRGEVLELPGADHALETPGDAVASARALTALTERVIDFVGR